MKLEKDKQIAAYYRGYIIQEVVEIEMRMEFIIGLFLSTNNHNRAIDLMKIFNLAVYNKKISDDFT